jgi:hypothetical protein
MSAEQVSLDLDARTPHERWMAALADRAKVTGQGGAAAADPEGFARALEAIAELSAEGEPFDSTDVRAVAGPFERPNVVGAAFSAARKAGLIEVAGYGASRTVSRHGSLVRLWRGTGGSP